MFSSLLIANRGEIACRVIKTARRLGIRTIAVYSDADREALHVRMADEAVHIGGSAAKDSYLSIAKVVAACKATGAEAVHPGYGFLSENPDFPIALKKAGIVFVGPPAKALAAMGDKIASKKLAAKAGVSTVPGHMGLIADADEAVKIAGKVGYPVMIKASAGGGGKGMRIAWNDAEAREGFARSQSEAASSFGDDRIFIEKFVTDPRHIEIQVLGDQHGNIVYLGERECSIQRRNQKVIEEAPSPFLDAKTRKAMGEQAVALARAVGYFSAGTVEFIVDSNRKFYFLEMNTRLQVEHPVTELITGLDLVELMLRVAAKEKLPFAQKDVKLKGWAIESRIYAEDPYRNFLPSTGRLTRYRPPAEVAPQFGTDGLNMMELEDWEAELHRPRVRNDTGVFEGGEITTFYDPMIAKLCTWGPTRIEAIEEMQTALDQFEVEGVGNNIPFLSAVMSQERFREGRLTTGYIAEEFPDGFHGATVAPGRHRQLVSAAAMLHLTTGMFRHPFTEEPARWTPEEVVPYVVVRHEQELTVFVDGVSFAVTAGHSSDRDSWHVAWPDGTDVTGRLFWKPGDTKAMLHWPGPGGSLHFRADRITGGFRIRHGGADLLCMVLPRHIADLMALMPVKTAPDMSRFLLCPMPGQVKAIMVAAGDIVEDGQALAIVEAMKMENVLRAEKRARVSKVRVVAGAVMAVDEVILEFEAV